MPHVLALRTNGASHPRSATTELGGYLATRHLLDLGHRRIGVIAGPTYASSARTRARATARRSRRRAWRSTTGWIRPSTFGMESGEDAARALLG